MTQQLTAPEQPPDGSNAGRPRPGRRVPALAAACLLVGLAAGFLVGQQRPGTHEAEVSCLSAAGGISCSEDEDRDSGELWVPRDVAWTDPEGTFHMGGRPTCLPSGGRGTERPVAVTWETIRAAGRSWRQAVDVVC